MKRHGHGFFFWLAASKVSHQLQETKSNLWFFFSRSALSCNFSLRASFKKAKLSELVASSLDSQLLDEEPGFETTEWDDRLADSEAAAAGASDCRFVNRSGEELGSLLCAPATF